MKIYAYTHERFRAFVANHEFGTNPAAQFPEFPDPVRWAFDKRIDSRTNIPYTEVDLSILYVPTDDELQDEYYNLADSLSKVTMRRYPRTYVIAYHTMWVDSEAEGIPVSVNRVFVWKRITHEDFSANYRKYLTDLAQHLDDKNLLSVDKRYVWQQWTGTLC